MLVSLWLITIFISFFSLKSVYAVVYLQALSPTQLYLLFSSILYRILSILYLTLSLHLPLFLRAIVSEDLESRAPFLELHFPVEHDGGRDNNQMWPPVTLLTSEMGQERYGLNGFTETHLISKNTWKVKIIKTIVVIAVIIITLIVMATEVAYLLMTNFFQLQILIKS